MLCQKTLGTTVGIATVTRDQVGGAVFGRETIRAVNSGRMDGYLPMCRRYAIKTRSPIWSAWASSRAIAGICGRSIYTFSNFSDSNGSAISDSIKDFARKNAKVVDREPNIPRTGRLINSIRSLQCATIYSLNLLPRGPCPVSPQPPCMPTFYPPPRPPLCGTAKAVTE